MSQLLKHYFINRDTGNWATDTRFGLMMPSIKGLEIQYQLTTKNDVPFCLSTCPEFFEYSVTVSAEQLTELENNSNITIVSSTERQVEVSDRDLDTDEEVRIETVYDVVYTELYILEETEGEGLKIINQEEWDNEIALYDERQQQKRYDIIKSVCTEILSLTDWIVIRATEQGTILSEEFKTWRQSLRDLPDGEEFPTGFPPLPSIVENEERILNLYARWSEVASIPMINDPLPQQEDPVRPDELI
jgi:hypothetical protein